jgi:hypothetical protein
MKRLFAFGLSLGMVAALAVPATAAPAESSMTAGGAIVQGDYKITFGGTVKESAGDPDGFETGHFTVTFQNVKDPAISGGRFVSTSIPWSDWYPGDGDCEASARIWLEGRFNDNPDCQLRFIAGDNEDAVRIILSCGQTGYDSAAGDTEGEFDNEVFCEEFGEGWEMTSLDHGNVRITLAD